jgi:membrane protease YdiL (CAAX protease family)
LERTVLGYILVFVCVILTIRVSILTGEVLELNLELSLGNTELPYSTKLSNARFLYSVEPSYLDEHIQLKNDVKKEIDEEKSRKAALLGEGQETKEDTKQKAQNVKVPAVIIGNNGTALIYFMLYLVLTAAIGIHLIARYVTTPSWSDILSLKPSNVLSIGFGFISLILFFIAMTIGMFDVYDSSMFYLGPVFANAIILILLHSHAKSRGASLFREVGIIGCDYRKAILVGVAGYLTFLPLQVILNSQGIMMSYFLGFKIESHPFVEYFLETSSGRVQILIAILVMFSAPFFEEIFFRGLFLQSLEQKLSPVIACVVSGLMFGLFHMNFVSIFLIAFFGIHLAFLMQKTRSVITTIVVHFIFNTTSLLKLLIR